MQNKCKKRRLAKTLGDHVKSACAAGGQKNDFEISFGLGSSTLTAKYVAAKWRLFFESRSN